MTKERPLGFFGIYPRALNDAVDECEIAMRNLGMTEQEIRDMYCMADEFLEENGSFADITNSIITAYFRVTHDLIKQNFPGTEVDFYVNGEDSHLYVNGEEQI